MPQLVCSLITYHFLHRFCREHSGDRCLPMSPLVHGAGPRKEVLLYVQSMGSMEVIVVLHTDHLREALVRDLWNIALTKLPEAQALI